MIGQAGAESGCEIGLLADLSRNHVRLQRSDDLYVLTPLAPTWVEGRRERNERILSDGDLLQLGSSVQLRFRQPHPLSSSARLDLVSHHRPEPACDGLVLMAQSLVLGPDSTSHIRCKDWESAVLLFRRSDARWSCRSDRPITVDGVLAGNPAVLSYHARVCGEDFCFSIEPLG
jgi:hypothetical protein